MAASTIFYIHILSTQELLEYRASSRLRDVRKMLVVGQLRWSLFMLYPTLPYPYHIFSRQLLDDSCKRLG